MSNRTISVNARPQLINTVLAKKSSFLFANNDITNPVYIGNSPGVNANDTSAVQVPPLGSMTFDGQSDLYVVSAGPIVQCFMIPGGTYWSPSPAQTAAQINALGLAKDTSVQATTTAVGGTTTAVGGTTSAVNAISGQFVSESLYRTGTVNLTGGAGPVFVNLSPLVPVSLTGAGLSGAAVDFFSSYEISLVSVLNAAGSGIYTVNFQWFNDVADTVPVDQLIFQIPSSTGGITTLGKGPMRGNFLAVLVASNDPAAVTSTVNVNLTGSLRAPVSDDWRSGGVVGNSSSAKAWSGEILISSNLTINAGANINRDALLYSGLAHVMMENNSATGTLVATMTEILSGLEVFRTNVPQSAGGAAMQSFDIMMPRTPCRLNIINNGAAAVIGACNVAIIADRV